MNLVCMVTGHRWQEDPDAHETYPVIRCHRCGKHRDLAEQLVNPSWSGGPDVPHGSGSGYTGDGRY